MRKERYFKTKLNCSTPIEVRCPFKKWHITTNIPELRSSSMGHTRNGNSKHTYHVRCLLSCYIHCIKYALLSYFGQPFNEQAAALLTVCFT